MTNKIIIPQNVFTHTTTSYKYFWCISIIDIIESSGKTTITFDEIVFRMLDYALRISRSTNIIFPKQDKLTIIAADLQNCLNEGKDRSLYDRLCTNSKLHVVGKAVSHITQYVPYRFLTPWAGTLPDRMYSTVELMRSKGAPYSIKDKSIIIFDDWHSEIKNNSISYRIKVCHCLEDYLSKVTPNTISENDIVNILSEVTKASNLASDMDPKTKLNIKQDLEFMTAFDVMNKYNITLSELSSLSNSHDVDTENKDHHYKKTSTISVEKNIPSDISQDNKDTSKSPQMKSEEQIIRGKVTSIDSRLLSEILPLIEHNRLSAIMMLNNHYSTNTHVSMSIKDWAEFLDTLSDTFSGTYQPKNEAITGQQESTTNTTSKSRSNTITKTHSTTTLSKSPKKKIKEIKHWGDLHRVLIGYNWIEDVFGDIYGFPLFTFQNIKIDSGSITISVQAYSSISKERHNIVLLFSGVTYFYSSLEFNDEDDIESTILANDMDDYLMFKFDTGVLRLNCTRAEVLSIY